MANPQHDPKKTYVKIKMAKIKLDNIEINMFPLYFGFSPLGPTTPLTKEEVFPKRFCYGYWSNETEEQCGNELLPIQSPIFCPDFMKQPVPQWPYILAKVLQANETQSKKSLGFLIYILKAIMDHRHMDCGLEEFTAPKIDGLWYTDIDKFYRWMILTKNVAPF